ncbi:MAG: alkaline phosphatase [Congregibacter sp.]
MLRFTSLATAVALLSGCVAVTVVESQSSSVQIDTRPDGLSPLPAHQQNSPWYRDASQRVAAANAGRGAKNVVLFLGDGMGITTVTAARILAGQRSGKPGEENTLSFESFPVTGLVKTYNVNAQTADSAGTMSAIVTGVKTDIGVFGVDEQVEQGNCASGQGRELLSLLDIAELAGRATGVVSTARLTHATPGATYAKTAERDWEDDSGMPETARALGCTDVASQFVNYQSRLNRQFGAGASDGIEVALGGGRQHFLPESITGGRRKDSRNLIEDWQKTYPKGSYVSDARSMNRVRSAPLLGLFDASHMNYASMRSGPGAEQPSLPAMTLKALDILEKNDRGFLLVVEAGRIDHAHHAGNAANALNETIELAAAVEAVMRRVDTNDTLVMVTADHSHVMTMGGYPRRGNPILGKVIPAWSDEPSLADDGLPYTTLSYANGRGERDYGDEPNADTTYAESANPGRVDISNIDTTKMGYHQEAMISLNAETHGGEDVAVYAVGPGAGAAAGVNEQNLLFHVMLSATGWEAEAAARLVQNGKKP